MTSLVVARNPLLPTAAVEERKQKLASERIQFIRGEYPSWASLFRQDPIELTKRWSERSRGRHHGAQGRNKESKSKHHDCTFQLAVLAFYNNDGTDYYVANFVAMAMMSSLVAFALRALDRFAFAMMEHVRGIFALAKSNCDVGGPISVPMLPPLISC